MAHLAEQLKQKGNECFKHGDYPGAETYYSSAIMKNSQNPLLFTNRANARLKLERWNDVIDDCLKSVELLRENMKAYFLLAQAQLAINHPNEALSSALMAYELCIKSPQQTSSAATISALVLKCKKTKWEGREKERLRRRHELLAELEDILETATKKDVQEIEERVAAGEMGEVAGAEEKESIKQAGKKKVEDLKTAFYLSDPNQMAIREVPDYLVDTITFEIMHDPVVTKNGHSYERATIIEHLKRSQTDPLTREPLSIKDLRPNLALKSICTDFLEQNSGWVYDW